MRPGVTPPAAAGGRWTRKSRPGESLWLRVRVSRPGWKPAGVPAARRGPESRVTTPGRARPPGPGLLAHWHSLAGCP